jgi:DNA-binding protein HU-beta
VTKADLIDALAGEFNISKRRVGEMIDKMLVEITGALKAGDKVQLIPFGSFVIRERRRREGRNPKTGETIVIPARRVAAFVAGKGLREAVGGVRRKTAANGTIKVHA